MSTNRLLVVDDDAGFCDFVARVGRNASYETKMLCEHQAFRDTVQTWAPTVIVLDLLMPGADGIELLRDLQRLGSEAKIVITSGLDERLVDTAVRLGTARGLEVSGSLPKPVRAADLLRVLRANAAADTGVSVDQLDRALDEDRIALVYQPKFDLKSGAVIGVEALARWHDPARGVISPAEFIPIAEQNQLMGKLTNVVMKKAFAALGDWQRIVGRFGIAINMSAAGLQSLTEPDLAAELCAQSGIDPSDVTLELTETASMQNPAAVMDIMARLRLKGFKLSIDDFGTGYSSLVQLQRLPFTELKIDQSFVGQMTASKDCEVIVRTIIGMAANLGLAAVAEGIENEPTLRMLRTLGCAYGQGYHLARPVAAADIIPLIGRHTPGAAPAALPCKSA